MCAMFDMEIAWDRPIHSGPTATTHILRVRLSPNGTGREAPGIPLRLAIALDSSSSMEGEKLERAKQACRAMLGLLRPGDRFSLAAFGGELRQLVAAASVTLDGGSFLDTAIQGLRAEGVTRTDLALDWLASSLPAEPGVTRAAVLITDGFPTDAVGQALGELDPLLERANAMAGTGITLSTVGLGNAADFHTAFLVGLSDRGQGAFLYADTPERLEPQMRARLLASQSVALEDVRLELRFPSANVSLRDCCRLRPEFLPLEARGE